MRCTTSWRRSLRSQFQEPGCPVGHMQGVCRCKDPVLMFGHDESIFKEYQLSKRQWIVDGKPGLNDTLPPGSRWITSEMYELDGELHFRDRKGYDRP